MNELLKKHWFQILVVIAYLILAWGWFSIVNAPVQQGVTNFDSITLSDDLIVGDDLTVSGDTGVAGLTPTSLTVSGATALNGGLTMDTSKFTVADTSGNTVIAGTLDAQGNIFDSGGALTIADNVLVDGAADAIQIQAQGYTTQTNPILTIEQSDGTDVATISNAGVMDIASTFNYGADDLYPVGFASSGQQLVYGTSTITGTAVAAHGLTTVTFAICALGKQQDANTAGCSLVVSGNVVTLYTYEDDNTTQSTEASVPVHWLVIGAP